MTGSSSQQEAINAFIDVANEMKNDGFPSFNHAQVCINGACHESSWARGVFHHMSVAG